MDLEVQIEWTRIKWENEARCNRLSRAYSMDGVDRLLMVPELNTKESIRKGPQIHKVVCILRLMINLLFLFPGFNFKSTARSGPRRAPSAFF